MRRSAIISFIKTHNALQCLGVQLNDQLNIIFDVLCVGRIKLKLQDDEEERLAVDVERKDVRCERMEWAMTPHQGERVNQANWAKRITFGLSFMTRV